VTGLPAVITETVDTEAGERLIDAVLKVRQIVALTCGCLRYECDRPGGGVVHVVRGPHCQPTPAPVGAA
jgi:hypothetical protein